MIIFKWPTDGKFELPGLESKVKKAYLLADKNSKIDVKQDSAGATLSLPEKAPDAIASVVCVEIADDAAKVAKY
jgi:alpha-L-fucosidase